ncbi:MAG: mechanosensitive ion channel family protein [Oscillospiraceae bacterium]|jgi:small conductance mechanosensitive channel|nr:mechanosensitive ion channel family protein [Oscillospiraceae bacterium]
MLEFDFNEIVPKFLLTIALFFVSIFIFELVSRAIRKAMHRINAEKSVISFTYSASKVVFKILALFLALTIWIDARAVVATAGTVAVALGFIFKDVISNIIGGIIIVSNMLFKVEDFIEIEKNSGYVSKIELFFTTLKTTDNKKIIVPNSVLTSKMVVVNYEGCLSKNETEAVK